MKRVMFIILWAVAFFVAITIVGSICLPILCKIEAGITLWCLWESEWFGL